MRSTFIAWVDGIRNEDGRGEMMLGLELGSVVRCWGIVMRSYVSQRWCKFTIKEASATFPIGSGLLARGPMVCARWFSSRQCLRTSTHQQPLRAFVKLPASSTRPRDTPTLVAVSHCSLHKFEIYGLNRAVWMQDCGHPVDTEITLGRPWAEPALSCESRCWNVQVGSGTGGREYMFPVLIRQGADTD